VTQTSEADNTDPLAFDVAQRFIGEYIVIPAQSKGSIPAGLRWVGMCRTKCSSTTMLSEYPP
jgi:hypothetical protein